MFVLPGVSDIPNGEKMNLCFKTTSHKNDRAYKACHLALLTGLSLLLYFAAPTPARAILWPTVTEARITQCQGSSEGPCSSGVMYAGRVGMVEQGEPSVPYRPTDSILKFVGIHCSFGGNGKPFTMCAWEENSAHRPSMSAGCRFADTFHWDIDDVTQCSFGSSWGFHNGAGPGAECAMAGVMQGGELHTPWGNLNAGIVANTGARNCVQPPAPEESCSVGPLRDLQHGTLGPNASDQITIYTDVSCGSSPNVTIKGGNRLVLGPGVSTWVSVGLVPGPRLMVRSDLTITGAKPGAYSGNAIIIVSPN